MTDPISERELNALQRRLQSLCGRTEQAAADELAAFTGTSVIRGESRLRSLPAADLGQALAALGNERLFSGVVQAYQLEISPLFAMTVVTEESIADLSQLVSMPCSSGGETAELLFRLSEVLTESSLPLLARGLDVAHHCFWGDAGLLALHAPLERYQLHGIGREELLLTVECNYQLEAHPFNCDLLLVLPSAVQQLLVR
ncbi:hypothetical protein [Pseudomaricurvus sp. HS19]|uniref:hypothetical protein n=1 Tax=Pseudomaricurvus sp. HS19 TaxID=2692626 RepID=UPI001368D62F|nr:hypothetical protein [Pseudomaricurvus sp. HS19]MYM65010.1 hypothetical protein [Pseudomaricurvus sp. HS19]